MTEFKVDDRVEYTPTFDDTAYPGDNEQYRGQTGTVVEVPDDEQRGFYKFMGVLYGRDVTVVDVRWDNEDMQHAWEPDSDGIVGDYDPEQRTVFEANLSLVEGE